MACTLLVLAWQMLVLAKSHLLMGDFRAFYCGGYVVAHGGNPYDAAPIMACESRPQPFGFHRAPHGLAEPVPFPGYAFALFVPFSLLPFVPSALLWIAVQVAAMAIACVLIGRMCDRSAAAVLAVFALGYCAAVWNYGELASIALLGLAGAAYALKYRRFWLASGALCCAAILPHVVAPAFLALFACDRRGRVPLTVFGTLLIALDLAIGGPALAFSYFRVVLPAHAQSEIGYVTQYGLTWLLHAAGFSNRAALLCGDFSYALMVVAGIAIGRSLTRRLDEPAFTILTPAAFAVIGGPFMHYSEITLALPFVMLLVAREAGAVRGIASVALVLVALPWQWIIQAPLIVAFAAAAFGIAVLFLRTSANLALRTGLGAAAYCAAIVVCAVKLGPQLSMAAPAHLDPRLAQSSWAEYIRVNSSSTGAVWLIAKAPTWAGLLFLALCGSYAAAKKDFVARVVIKQAPIGP